MSREYEEHIYHLLNNLTQGGTPLPALVGSKQEWQVTTLVAGLLANANISASLDAEEIVEAAINYANIIQDKLGEYQNAKIHSLERLIEWPYNLKVFSTTREPTHCYHSILYWIWM